MKYYRKTILKKLKQINIMRNSIAFFVLLFICITTGFILGTINSISNYTGEHQTNKRVEPTIKISINPNGEIDSVYIYNFGKK